MANGIHITSLPELESYNGNAVVYAVADGQDKQVKLRTLVEHLKDGVAEARLPEDVVRTADMEEHVKAEIAKIPPVHTHSDEDVQRLARGLAEWGEVEKKINAVKEALLVPTEATVANTKGIEALKKELELQASKAASKQDLDVLQVKVQGQAALVEQLLNSEESTFATSEDLSKVTTLVTTNQREAKAELGALKEIVIDNQAKLKAHADKDHATDLAIADLQTKLLAKVEARTVAELRKDLTHLEAIVDALPDSEGTATGTLTVEGTPVAGRPLTVNAEGKVVTQAKTPVMYVADSTVPAEKQDGSYELPYNTLQRAVDNAPTAQGSVHVVVKTGTFAGLTVNNRQSLIIEADAGAQVLISSPLVFGGTIERVTLRNLSLNPVEDQGIKVNKDGGEVHVKLEQIDDITRSQRPEMTHDQTGLMFHGQKATEKMYLKVRHCKDLSIQANATLVLDAANSTLTYVATSKANDILNIRHCSVKQIEQRKGDINIIYSQVGQVLSFDGSLTMDFVDLTFNRNHRKGAAALDRRQGRPAVLSFVKFLKGLDEIKGQVKFETDEHNATLAFPEFTVSVAEKEADELNREATVKLVSTNGYFGLGFEAALIQGENAEALENRTTFQLPYDGLDKKVDLPKVEGQTQVFLVLKDKKNADRTFTYGPFNLA